MHDGLTAEQLLVLDALPLRSWALPEGLSRAAGLPVVQVMPALGDLLGRGLAEGKAGRWRRAGVPRRR